MQTKNLMHERLQNLRPQENMFAATPGNQQLRNLHELRTPNYPSY